MNRVNQALSRLGFAVFRVARVPGAYARDYHATYRRLRRHPPIPFSSVVSSFTYEAGDHPVQWWDFECAFAAEHIARIRPHDILDIGSLRSFITGLLAHYHVTTVDVRARTTLLENETAVTSDAKRLDLPDASYDALVSLCSLEHFGLGRYGDDLDMEGDRTAFAEMIRVLRPGGRLIFTTTLRNGDPVLAFNEQRIYNLELIHKLAAPLICEDERAYNRERQQFCRVDELPPDDPPSWESWWHIYCGCWRKP